MTNEQIEQLVANLNKWVTDSVECTGVHTSSLEEVLEDGEWVISMSSMGDCCNFMYSIDISKIHSIGDLSIVVLLLGESLHNTFYEDVSEKTAWWLTQYVASEEFRFLRAEVAFNAIRRCVNVIETNVFNGLNLAKNLDLAKISVNVF